MSCIFELHAAGQAESVRVHGQVKLLEGRGFGDTRVARFLEQAVEPPPAVAVTNALRLLEAIGALEEGTERLTVRTAWIAHGTC